MNPILKKQASQEEEEDVQASDHSTIQYQFD
jgi:hypothetical protein